MLHTDPRRAMAKNIIRTAIALLTATESKDLDPSDKKIVPVALKKLAAVAHSLGGLKPPSDDSIAARLSAVALSVMNCNEPALKNAAYAQITKAAKMFDEMSQGA
jgi:hypothetical protein